jgi:hypothetical protein
LLALGVIGCSSKGTRGGPLVCDQGSICRDSDCDTICDIYEGDDSRDTDHDGIPDYLDTDSDNDGISDRDEAGDDDPRTPPVDRNQDGIPDYLDPNYPLRAGHVDASVSAPPPPADAGVDAGNDAGLNALCPSDQLVTSACQTDERGATACDGLDNDCDGRVDNDNLCACQRGEVRGCFLGPPGLRHVGACEDGTQLCEGEAAPHWGPCSGGALPQPERCDHLDNDCNGCRDDIAGCASTLSCPPPGDPRIPDAKPFNPYELDAKRFYPGTDVMSYRWLIRGSPCDRLFAALDPNATAQSGEQSFRLLDPNAAHTQVLFSLSGAYAVTLIISTPSGQLRCDWVVHVRAPGLRIELCWDKTGPRAQNEADAVDLDLHLGKYGQTSGFSQPDDCYWQTCSGIATPWSYPPTSPLSDCTGSQAQNYAVYQALGFCPNPRLDTDNRLNARSRAAYLTENINLDDGLPGDRFRVAVQYSANVRSDAADSDAGQSLDITTHPLVNIYCSGELQATLGGDPEQSGDAEELSLSRPGQLWRAVDITLLASGCTLSPLSDPRLGHGYWVTEFDYSYEGGP